MEMDGKDGTLRHFTFLAKGQRCSTNATDGEKKGTGFKNRTHMVATQFKAPS